MSAAAAPAAISSALSSIRIAPFRRPRAATIALTLVGLGTVLRLAPLLVPHFFFADEIFQYLEPAHRLVFGEGIVTWEQRIHIRPWSFPLALAAPMWLGGVIAPGTITYLLFPKLMLLALSLASLWGAAQLGRRISPLHGLLALFVAATWFERIYFSTQALTEAAAVPLFLTGAALSYRSDRSALIAAGTLLAAGALLRFQYGPAIGAFALVAARIDRGRIIALALGAGLAIVCSAVIDVVMGGVPFGWLIENLHQNIGLQRLAHVGFRPGLLSRGNRRAVGRMAVPDRRARGDRGAALSGAGAGGGDQPAAPTRLSRIRNIATSC